MLRRLRILAIVAAYGYLGYMLITAKPLPPDPECLAKHTAYECSFITRAKAYAEGDLTLFP